MAGNEPDYRIGEQGWFFEITDDGYATIPQRTRSDAISKKASADARKKIGLSYEHIVLYRIPREESRDDFPENWHISMLGEHDEDGLIVHGPNGFLTPTIYKNLQEAEIAAMTAAGIDPEASQRGPKRG